MKAPMLLMAAALLCSTQAGAQTKGARSNSPTDPALQAARDQKAKDLAALKADSAAAEAACKGGPASGKCAAAKELVATDKRRLGGDTNKIHLAHVRSSQAGRRAAQSPSK